jgi:hypothetical protein
MGIKILISYIVVCVTYSLCRLHFLLTQKTDEEFNSMLSELKNLADGGNVIFNLVLLQILFAPLTAPFSIMKLVYKQVKKLFVKN